MSGCGGDCLCAKMEKAGCETLPEEKVEMDEDGKCPCGKDEKDCCHYEESETEKIPE